MEGFARHGMSFGRGGHVLYETDPPLQLTCRLKKGHFSGQLARALPVAPVPQHRTAALTTPQNFWQLAQAAQVTLSAGIQSSTSVSPGMLSSTATTEDVEASTTESSSSLSSTVGASTVVCPWEEVVMFGPL